MSKTVARSNKMSQTAHILICDDDPIVHESLSLYLDSEHYTHADAFDGAESLRMVNEEKPDLILLDVMMPEMSGLEVCREVRKNYSTPIIILTAKGEEIDRVLGLELGADDYIVKPFSPREVIARIKAVLRRTSEVPESKVNGDPIQCTPKEVEILHLLASHPGQVMGREQILALVWGNDYYGDSRTVDTHIKRIRQKISVTGATWSIQTVYSVGYKFEVE